MGDLDEDARSDIATLTWDTSMLRVRARRGFDGKSLWSRDISATDGWIMPMSFGEEGPGVLMQAETFSELASVSTLQAIRADGSIAWQHSIPNSYVIGTGRYVPGGATDVLVATVMGVSLYPRTLAAAKLAVVRGSDGRMSNSATLTRGWTDVLQTVGDLDGDTLDDVVASAQVESSFVVQAARARDGAPLWTTLLDGVAVAATDVGDTNGDGRRDIAVTGGDNKEEAFANHHSWLLDGANGIVLWRRNGRVIPAGDIDGDGPCDLLVIDDRKTEAGPVVNIAAVTADGSQIYAVTHSLTMPDGAGQYAEAQAAGDLNDDGITDVLDDLIVDSDGPRERRITATSGRDGATLWSIDMPSGWITPLKASLGGTGDDVARSVFDESTDEVHIAALDGATSAVQWSFDRPWGIWLLTVVGDIDGDGASDVALSSGFAGPLGTERDRMFQSMRSGFDGSVLWTS